MESYYKQNKKLITDILDILEGHFGKNVEFVVHDLSLDYEHTIVDIRNGEVTGRKVGGTGDLLGLRALRYNGSNEGNCFNTLTYAENGKILRSSTLFFRNGAGVAVASIAINEDVTESIKYEQYLHKTEPHGGKRRRHGALPRRREQDAGLSHQFRAAGGGQKPVGHDERG